MTHVQLRVYADLIEQETVMALLLHFSPTGFEQLDDHVIAYFEETDLDMPALTKVLGDRKFNTHRVQAQNWNALWERNFSPVVIGAFCVIRAHFHQQQPGVLHDIIITPKMSFGTGHHATTAMMVKAMASITFKRKTVFDFGTGTGILAVLAQKMGATQVVAIDVDEWSVENAKENILQNGADGIEVRHTTELPAGKFDVILANINRNVLLQYMPELAQLLNSEAHLLLSGILTSDEQDLIRSCSSNGLEVVARSSELDWCMMVLKNKG